MKIALGGEAEVEQGDGQKFVVWSMTRDQAWAIGDALRGAGHRPGTSVVARDAFRDTAQALFDLGREAEKPCVYCKGTRWTNDENWQPEDPRSWDGSRSRGAGRIPCGGCNLGGWDIPDGDEQAAAGVQ